jgi:hypothetical protein
MEANIPTLFLDIDGVANNMDANMEDLQEDKLRLLARIYDETDCRIVLISQWRSWPFKLVDLHRALEGFGLVLHSHTPVLDYTEPGCRIVRARPRFLEIDAWLDEHPETGNYVILDDQHDFGPLEAHHVQPRSDKGLTAALAEEVIRLLLLLPTP